jgi:tRNA A-37 threonylcarbamoyl transferase component Bud32
MSPLARLPSLADYTAALSAHGVRADTLVVDEKGTLCRSAQERTNPRSGLTLLQSAEQPEIVVETMLSRGAQGEVWLAEQPALRRHVAVKIPRASKDGTLDPERVQGLLVEARVSGRLEHPNIVPIHIVGADADGTPLLVMKRVEGATWRELLAKQRDLDRDVDVFIAVCRALAFAHAHGVAHCDVKPANVMVGVHDDVYLVDWGVAVGFGDAAPADVPHAKDVKDVFGTPKYLAPEMALPTGAIDGRTDVYLCGAVLFELINGAPLHKGKSTEAVLHAAHVADVPAFVDDAPEELVAVCKRAIARDPAERFQSADALRVALEAYRDHKTARALCVAADERLVLLRATPFGGVDDDVRAQRLFSECRFGYEMALSSWPESQRARDSLDACIGTMARREVVRGNLASARALLADLHVDDAALAADVDALAEKLRAAESNRVALENFAHQQDIHVAERERGGVVFGAGLAWLATMVVLHLLDRRAIFRASPSIFAAFMAAFAAVLIAIAAFRPSVRSTERSRSLWFFYTATAGGLALLHTLAWRSGLDVGVSLSMGHVLYSVTATGITVQEPRLFPVIPVCWCVVIALVIAPTQALLVSGVGGFLMLAVGAWVITRPRKA